MNYNLAMNTINQRYQKARRIRNKAKEIIKWMHTHPTFVQDHLPLINSYFQAALDQDLGDAIQYYLQLETIYFRGYR